MPDVPGIINFPASLDTSVTLIQVQDLATTVLQAPGVTSTSTTFVALSTAKFPNSGAFTVEGEHITYTSKDATHFFGCARGQFTSLGGASQAAHSAGVTINQLVIAGTHQVQNNAIIAAETKLGTGASVPSAGTFLKGTGAGSSGYAALTSGEIAAALGFTPAPGVVLQESDVTKVASATTLDVDGNYLTVSESPSGEGNLTFASAPVVDVGTLVISAGVVTIPAVKGNATVILATIDTEGAAAADDLDQISVTGSIPAPTKLILKSLSGSRIPTVKHDGTKIALGSGAQFPLATTFHRLELVRSGTTWVETARQPLPVGTVVQAWDADLDALAATPTNYFRMPGEMVMYGGAAAPTGWLLCDGTSYLRATYPNLFAAIGTAFGSVDGTHFTVPDLRDRFPIGKGVNVANDALGETGGLATVTLSAAESGIPAHNHVASSGTESANHQHTFSDYYPGLQTNTSFQSGGQPHVGPGTTTTVANTTNSENIAHTHAITVSANAAAAATSAHTNLPPFLAVNYIIKI